MNKIEYEELIAFHPGYYVKDYIEDRGDLYYLYSNTNIRFLRQTRIRRKF